MTDPRLTLSNRAENLQPLMNYVRHWAEGRGLSRRRRRSLEKVVEDIFHHLVTFVYLPEEHGSIGFSLAERGPRLRLMFEDDAAPHHPGSLPAPDGSAANGCGLNNRLQPLAESLVYYRTADRKNRTVVFLT